MRGMETWASELLAQIDKLISATTSTNKAPSFRCFIKLPRFLNRRERFSISNDDQLMAVVACRSVRRAAAFGFNRVMDFNRGPKGFGRVCLCPFPRASSPPGISLRECDRGPSSNLAPEKKPARAPASAYQVP